MRVPHVCRQYFPLIAGVDFTNGGRVGLAHIAKLSDAAASAWSSCRLSGDVIGLNEWKVPLPAQTKFSASVLFLDLSNPSSVGLTRVELHARSMVAHVGRPWTRS